MYEYISQRWFYLCFCSVFNFLHETALIGLLQSARRFSGDSGAETKNTGPGSVLPHEGEEGGTGSRNCSFLTGASGQKSSAACSI